MLQRHLNARSTSRSYPVYRNVLERKEVTMKAKVKSTGEIINVASVHPSTNSVYSLFFIEENKGTIYDTSSIEILEPPKQRDERIKIATAVLQGRFSVLSTQFLDREMLRSYVVEALEVADILLEEVNNPEKEAENND